jgi:DNA mismatch endonuclease Vsr
MQANKSKDTKPEIAIRSLLHAHGYRFRLHSKNLPGRPDIVLPGRKCVVEVRGCFWHGHGCSPLGQLPKSRREYWQPKIAGNKERDAKNVVALEQLGWSVLEVWECDVRARPKAVLKRLISFLGPAKK